MASTNNETSLCITAINERKPEIGSLNRGASDCLPIYIKMESHSAPQNLGKTSLSLTFQAILALFFSLPSASPPPLPTILFLVAMFIGFAASLAGVFLQNAFPGIATVLEKCGVLSAAIGICIIASQLLHPNLAWLCWVACASSLLAFGISFK